MHPCPIHDLMRSKVPGVRRAGVFLLAETAHVELDPEAVQLDRLLAAIEGAGFTAQLLDATGALVGEEERRKGGCLLAEGGACIWQFLLEVHSRLHDWAPPC